jgi:hypothetical protein
MMSPDQSNIQQARMKEFMQLLPLTIEIAGLARAEHGKQFTEGQLEVRVTMLKNSFKLAKQMLIDISKSGNEG